MILPDYPYKDSNGVSHSNLIRHYSTKGMKICQNETGMIIDDAVDRYPCHYTYSETNIPIREEVSQHG